ncbi:hypothetical protein Ddye_013770 [Dipteronia dyeriana]|uniref:Uncharacterized protein n=1 Tax=Dipteronia dyeriana TaxID=168575 RepID=A0AAD9X6W2_9ROSI|nr:hypothetical protein Ddye_013770 [Dipteronia dyeriana]
MDEKDCLGWLLRIFGIVYCFSCDALLGDMVFYDHYCSHWTSCRSVIAVGSLSICMNINGWEGMLFIGVNAAIRIWAGIIIMATRNHFYIIFTSSKEMQKAVAHLASLLGITMVLNIVQPVISGVAVGVGWQALVAYINLFCYYVVGLPLGFLLGYKTSLGVEGIWIGMICGTCLQTMILIYSL